MKSLAITDHGVMYGCVDFYKAAVEHGIKPIIGSEIYIVPNLWVLNMRIRKMKLII